MAAQPAKRKPRPVRPTKRPTNTTVKARRSTNGNGKYNDDYPELAYRLCTTFGADNIALAKALGVHESTVKNWLREHQDFREQVLKGKDEYDSTNVEKSLLQRALGYTYEEKKTEDVTLKIGKGKAAIQMPATKRTTTVKQVAPDVVAQIFWLKNRQSDRWKDVRQEIMKGSVDHQHQHKHEVPVIDPSDIDRTGKVYDILRAARALPTGIGDGPSTQTH